MNSLRSLIDGETRTQLPADTEGDVSEVESENDNIEIENDAENGQTSEEDEAEIHRGLKAFELKVVKDQLDWKSSQEIWEKHKKCLKYQSEVNQKNILHLLVDNYVEATSGKEKGLIARAFTKITAKYPALIQQLDKDKQTPLYKAIDGKKSTLVEIIVAKCTSKSDAKKGKKDDPLSKALGVKCTLNGNTENCLHLALKAGLDVVSPPALKKLAKKATEETIADTDKHGFTPLHHAVAYGKITEERYEVIKILLKKGDSKSLVRDRVAVLDKFADKDKLSVYQYHLHTREIFKEKLVAQKIPPSLRLRHVNAGKQEDERQIGPEKARQSQSQPDEKKRETQSGKVGPGGKEGPPGERQNQNRKDEKDGPGGARQDNRQERGGKEEPDRAEPDGRLGEPRDKRDAWQNNTLGGGKQPLARRVTHKEPEEKEESPEEKKRKRDEWSEKIKNELKIQCLRTRTHKEATRFLYGKNPNDIQICFDYYGLGAIADAEAFEESFKNVTFDSVLQYVAFPSVMVENWTPKDIQSGARGRADMMFFFTWLEKEKKVERILRVIVDDRTDPPHSDEAIKKSLAPFGVEILNWSKPDLDPVTICNASKELREVHLHWSGNNTVLRGWSEPCGLRMAPNLGVVHLSVDSTLESSACTQENLAMFKTRLKTPYPAELAIPKATTESRGPEITKVELQRVDTDTLAETKAEEKTKTELFDPQQPQMAYRPIEVKGGLDGYGQRSINTTASASGERGGLSFPSHRWLEYVDKFGDQIWNVWSKILSESKDKKPQEIIVALIDDGVDHTHPPLMGSILTGRTLSYEGDRIRPWYVSERGHGTVMASMICRVCPMVKVYPIRLNTLGQKGQIDVESAALAIEAAVDRGAHIISMSWTVAPPKGDMKKAFDSALQKAIENNILMFCSSKDSGHFSDLHYPSGYRNEAVFKIGAANQNGLPHERAGSLDRLDYIFPGVEVVQRHAKAPPGVENSSFLSAETGSSVATALGAGLAALIMYCAKIGFMYGKVGLKEEDVSRLSNYNVMHDAITAFGASTSDQTKGKFIEVWKMLETKTKELSRGVTQQQARDLIADLARDLVKRS